MKTNAFLALKVSTGAKKKRSALNARKNFVTFATRKESVRIVFRDTIWKKSLRAV